MAIPDDARCIGIDLAWSARHPTGVAALAWSGDALQVTASGHAMGDDEIIAFVAGNMGRQSVIMVDAPLVVPNETGRRGCEAELQRRFGRFEAGAHPANRTLFARYGGVRGERLALALAPRGVRFAALDQAGTGHTLFECYPHPAQVVLFGLSRTLKYKKKRQPWTVAREEFRRLLAYLAALEDPPLRLDAALRDALDPGDLVGRGYKAREDRLDAIFCAYLAALALLGRMEMIGSVAEGHIVVPAAPQVVRNAWREGR